MNATWRYTNPVQITFGAGAIDTIADKIATRPYCLLTYHDHPFFADTARRIAALAGSPAVIVRDVIPNPDYPSLRAACASLSRADTPPQLIVALGGGSVIDTAKVMAAAGNDFAIVQNYIEGRSAAESLKHLPIIAVPTTAGTGSEVTSWATVWDTESKKKYSLAGPGLYPEHAILDPDLTLGVPKSLTVSTGLDALSHALESIWNVNANPVSANHAVFAAREIVDCLPELADDLANATLRSRMARASLFAGLAFSNTKTALAHSLSYYLTLHRGTVHGIACSFSLPAVMRSVIGTDPDCDAALRGIFGADLARGAEELSGFLHRLGVTTRIADYGVNDDEWRDAIDDALLGERGRNFIGKREALLGAAFV